MIRSIIRNAGIHPRNLLKAICGWRRYIRERGEFRKLVTSDEFPWASELPMLTEWDDAAGCLGTYFYQDQLVARWIHDAAPSRHVDAGSRIDGFIGSISVFREVDVIDIRPLPQPVTNVRFHQLDLMQPLPTKWLESTDSLSCLHAIEHFGLGRYGDTIDPTGHIKGIAQMKQIVSSGGLFYLSTPIGPQRIEFNAHRVFAAQTVIDWFKDGWAIERFAVIDDNECLHEAVDWTGPDVADHFGCRIGVAIVAARKVG